MLWLIYVLQIGVCLDIKHVYNVRNVLTRFFTRLFFRRGFGLFFFCFGQDDYSIGLIVKYTLETLMLGAWVFTLNEFLEFIIQTYIANDREHEYLWHPASRLVAPKWFSLGMIALHVTSLVRQSLDCSHILGHCHDWSWKKEIKFPVDTHEGQCSWIYEHDWVLKLLDVVLFKTWSTILDEV